MAHCYGKRLTPAAYPQWEAVTSKRVVGGEEGRAPIAQVALQAKASDFVADQLFNVYRDEDIGVDHSLEEESPGLAGEDCESDEEMVAWEQRRCQNDI